jgi:hypothetical protein
MLVVVAVVVQILKVLAVTGVVVRLLQLEVVMQALPIQVAVVVVYTQTAERLADQAL